MLGRYNVWAVVRLKNIQQHHIDHGKKNFQIYLITVIVPLVNFLMTWEGKITNEVKFN